MLSYFEFINENKENVLDGDLKITPDMIVDGKLNIPRYDRIKGTFEADADIEDIKSLTSLEGSPIIIEGSFYFNGIGLTSLEGGPKEVDKDFVCTRSNISNLKGLPILNNVKHFDLSQNMLTTLEGAPKVVPGFFTVGYNRLTSLEDGPKKVEGLYGVKGNVVDLDVESEWLQDEGYEEGENYYIELLKYCISKKFKLSKVNWPEGFLDTNAAKSAGGVIKFDF